MVYPTLPSDRATIRITEGGLSPYYDIVWSFDYYLENIQDNTEFGFLFFLQEEDTPLNGGNYGIDLGYSGLSSQNTGAYAPFLSAGMAGGVIGVGFDSTGCFALSASSNGLPVRDGKPIQGRIPNSVAIRGEAPDFSFDKYNINYHLSAFDIIDPVKKTVRARLGNLGRTFYVDWRRTPEEKFINLLTQDISLNTALSARLRPGVTINKPISSSLSTSVPTAIVENFHVEGKIELPDLDFGSSIDLPVLSSTFFTLSCVDNKLCLYQCVIQDNTTVCSLISCDDFSPCNIDPEDEIIVPPIDIQLIPRELSQLNSQCTLIDVVSGFVCGLSGQARTIDVFNYGYRLSSVNIPQILYRTNYFEYKSLDNTITLTQTRTVSGAIITPWILDGVGVNILTGETLEPIGTYTNSLTTIEIGYL